MEITINCQKILRTGDILIDKHTGKKGVVHYLYPNSGEAQFEVEISNLKSVQLFNGSRTTILSIKEIDLPRRKNGTK